MYFIYIYIYMYFVCANFWFLIINLFLTFKISTLYPQRAFLCFVWISEQTVIFPYTIN
jgi:hypothetical protein